MVFSLVGAFLIGLVSWKLTELFLPVVSSFLQEPLQEFISNVLNSVIDGEFCDILEFEKAILNSKYSMFIIIKKLLGDLSFDGCLTAGQIMAPSLSFFATKVILFVVLFFVLNFLFKLIRLLINKVVKVCGLSFGNRLLGGLVGVLKGVCVFVGVYFLLVVVSNVVLSESLNNFMRSGVIAKSLYELVLNFI